MERYMVVFETEGAAWYYAGNLPIASVPRKGFLLDYFRGRVFNSVSEAQYHLSTYLKNNPLFRVVEDTGFPLSVYAGPETNLIYDL